MDKKQSECRSCKAPIFWATTSQMGRKVPVDVEPRSDGNIIIEGDPSDDNGVAKYIEADNPYTGPRYVSHFATCPQAKTWKR